MFSPWFGYHDLTLSLMEWLAHLGQSTLVLRPREPEAISVFIESRLRTEKLGDVATLLA